MFFIMIYSRYGSMLCRTYVLSSVSSKIKNNLLHDRERQPRTPPFCDGGRLQTKEGKLPFTALVSTPRNRANRSVTGRVVCGACNCLYKLVDLQLGPYRSSSVLVLVPPLTACCCCFLFALDPRPGYYHILLLLLLSAALLLVVSARCARLLGRVHAHTPRRVTESGARHLCCANGVWFGAPAAT